MNALSNLPAFQAYATSVIVLGLNLIGLSNATALTRGQASEVINPEDKALNKKAEVVFEGGNDRTARYRRAHRNALENTPWFMTTALVLTLLREGDPAVSHDELRARAGDPGGRARLHRLRHVRGVTFHCGAHIPGGFFAIWSILAFASAPILSFV